ncbi:MAG: DNA polymerase III subunit delta [Deltaproteobacteria bacterium]|nr:DNA polymerase III subunit delta [Deltaproteobacteria bacterium]
MTMTIPQLDRHLQGTTLAPLYLLLGAEAFLARTATDRILAAVERLTGSPVVPQRLDVATCTPRDVVERVAAYGLFATTQVLVIAHVDAWKADGWDPLLEYLAAPNPDAVMILTAEKLDQRTKAGRALTGHAAVVQCRPLYANQIPDWIRMECQRHAKTIARDAAELLAEYLGTDLTVLADSIARMALFLGSTRMIDMQTVEQIVVEASVKDIFALTRAVGEGRQGKAIDIVERLLAAHEPAVRLLTMLARHWRLLYQSARWLHAHPYEERAMATALKVHPFFVAEYAQQAQRRPAESFGRGFAVLAEADRLLKRTQRPVESVLTDCLLQLTMVR